MVGKCGVSLNMWSSVRVGFLFTQESVLDIGPVLIFLFYFSLLLTKKKTEKNRTHNNLIVFVTFSTKQD